MSPLDKHFHDIGLRAILDMKDAKLIATANSVENFTLWCARTAEWEIVGAVDIDDDEHTAWINRHGTKVEAACAHLYGKKEWPPASKNPFIQSICIAAYAALRS